MTSSLIDLPRTPIRAQSVQGLDEEYMSVSRVSGTRILIMDPLDTVGCRWGLCGLGLLPTDAVRSHQIICVIHIVDSHKHILGLLAYLKTTAKLAAAQTFCHQPCFHLHVPHLSTSNGDSSLPVAQTVYHLCRLSLDTKLYIFVTIRQFLICSLDTSLNI